MAIGWIYLRFLHKRGIFNRGAAKVLDIGYQNLHDIPEDEGLEFAIENGAEGDIAELRSALRNLSARSPHPTPAEVTKPVFFAELTALCRIEYLSYEIFAGRNVQIFDLNRDEIPDEHKEHFDCVFNFGTTEHVFNQYNAFKVIHDATRVGGVMFHQVPCVGYINHGYWIYSPRTFLELATANSYDVEAFWITGPQGTTRLDLVSQSPEMSWDDSLPENFLRHWATHLVPNGLINALFRKRRGDRFRLPLDTSTSVGATDETVAARYGE
jgi:SAM-dependent methyltransferase